MKRTLRFLPTALVALGLLLHSTATARGETDGPWTTDYPAAVARAKAESRPLFLLFTGSDWCPYCIVLEKEILGTPEFAHFARDQLVAVFFDFPRHKRLEAALEKQNAAVSNNWDVHAYPTVLIVAPDGRRLGQLGYMEGGPKTFIRAIRQLLREGAATPPPSAPTSTPAK